MNDHQANAHAHDHESDRHEYAQLQGSSITTHAGSNDDDRDSQSSRAFSDFIGEMEADVNKVLDEFYDLAAFDDHYLHGHQLQVT